MAKEACYKNKNQGNAICFQPLYLPMYPHGINGTGLHCLQLFDFVAELPIVMMEGLAVTLLAFFLAIHRTGKREDNFAEIQARSYKFNTFPHPKKDLPSKSGKFNQF